GGLAVGQSRYLSGFTGSAGTLIVTAEKQAVATDFRYYQQVSQECPEWELIEAGHDLSGKLLDILRDMGLGGCRVGFEATHINVSTLHSWEQALKGHIKLTQVENCVETIRMSKDAGEIARLKKAIALADEAWHYISDLMAPGMTEKEVGWQLEQYMRTNGAEGISFTPIVASGPNGGKPHAQLSERQLQAGEAVTLDFGCVVDGYCSDITRTVCLGTPKDEKYLEIWNIVAEAQQAALQGSKAGMTGAAVDKLARDVIAAAGYKDNFGHGLGHGVGLAVHENPRFSFTYPKEVPAGAIMSVEPGIYIPDWGGVRIEDLVLVTEDGFEVLSQAPKEAVI
ncbi:MAG: aminopeptidase P family protein, partial [Chloroflexota bacterium]